MTLGRGDVPARVAVPEYALVELEGVAIGVRRFLEMFDFLRHVANFRRSAPEPIAEAPVSIRELRDLSATKLVPGPFGAIHRFARLVEIVEAVDVGAREAKVGIGPPGAKSRGFLERADCVVEALARIRRLPRETRFAGDAAQVTFAVAQPRPDVAVAVIERHGTREVALRLQPVTFPDGGTIGSVIQDDAIRKLD
jgi:hypothetical protein